MERVKLQSGLKAAPVVLGMLIVLLWSPPVSALNASLEIDQYAHSAWTYGNSFPSGAVYAISQTADGYLWLGTQSGAFRFDGVRAVPLVLSSGQQLPGTVVEAFLPARDGTLWIGAFDGLVSWKNGRITEYPALAHHIHLTLLQDRAGTVWTGAVKGPTGRLCAIRDGNVTCFGDDGSLGSAVTSLYEDGDGNLWVGAGTGLWRWNPGPPKRYLITPIRSRQALAQGDHGSALLAGADGVRQIAGARILDYPVKGAPLPLNATCLLRDRDGGLWIGTAGHGLIHSYEGKTSVFTHQDGLSSDHVNALFEDREGTIWAGTSDGLDQFHELPVTSLSLKQGLSSARTTSVLAARDGSIWIGTEEGLNRWKNGHTTIYRSGKNPGLPDDEIQSLFEDERGRIWVSGYRGLAAFEKGKFAPEPSVPAGAKNAIASDGHGGLWLSLWLPGNEYGLAHLTMGKITERVPWQIVGGGPGSGLVADPDGAIWTGLIAGGIARFRAGQIQRMALSNQSPDTSRVLNLSRDREGRMWAATENGVSRIVDGRVATLSTANGLPCDAVHWIMEDDLSSWWLYTRCGLLRIARTELDAWIADPKRVVQVTKFDASDGVRLIPLLGFRPFVSKSSNGRIWFRNGYTVSYIDPSHLGANTVPPAVHVEQITANGKAYDARRGLRLPPHVHDLTINYTALSLAVPEKIRFRYMLEGQDSGWREVVNKREAEYSNLAPRDYRFRVMASNNSGVWNNEGDVLNFSIAPALYEATWFRLLAVAASLIAIWSIYNVRVRMLERRNREVRALNEALRRSEAYLAEAQRLSHTGSWVWNVATREQTHSSEEHSRLFGFDPGSGVPSFEEIAQRIHPDDRARIRELFDSATRENGDFETDFQTLLPDGEVKQVHVIGHPVFSASGAVVEYVGTTIDVTDRKRAEEQRGKLRQLEADLAHINRVSIMGELTASIAHEVNQPLAGVVNNASAGLRWLAGDSPNLEEAREGLRRIVRDGKRAGEVIARIRTLTRKTTAPREKLDLNQTIRDVLALIGDEAKRNTVMVQAELAGDLAPVAGDRVQLQQVALNLVINAIEAMSRVDGRPRELVITTRNAEDNQVRTMIEDSGPGLDRDAIPRIFDSFYSTKPGGMGMGLSISRSIIEAHGGKLWATARDGPGASFHFTLPKYHEEESHGVLA